MQTVGELRQILIDNGAYDKAEANLIKGKAKLKQLVEELEQTEDEENVPEDVIFEPEPEVQLNVDDIPSYSSIEWPEYVMTLFTPDELSEGKYPTCDGMRRLTEEMLGEIVSSRPVSITHFDGGVSVQWHFECVWMPSLPPSVEISRDLPTRVFGAVADATLDNTKYPYSNHLTSMADTRAEAKALRRALRLTTISAEEAEGEDDVESSGSKINGSQCILIEKNCIKYGIDETKFLKSKGKEIKNELSKEEAVSMLSELRGFGEDPQSIPNEIRVGE